MRQFSLRGTQINPGNLLSTSTLILFFSLILLAGCGGERDEPFAPIDDDDEDTDPPVVVAMQVEHSGNTPWQLSETEGNKRIEVIRNETDYFTVLSDYIDTMNISAPNFETGQVVLYDAGSVNNNPCAHELDFESAKAQEETDSVVKVILTYSERTPTDTTCDEDADNDDLDIIAPSRPFRFFYVQTRDAIIVEETLTE